MTSGSQNIGFVGLGHMGGNMAARYLAAGYTVHGEARSKAGAEELIEGGLRWAATPREIAESVEIVFTSIPNDDVLRDVASGPDGIVAGLGEGKTWIDMSTVSPAASREVAEQVKATGGAMLDAPVSGSVPQVKSGTLTIMVGGDEDAYQRVEPVLEELGTPTYIGESGQGLVMKLAINISLAVQMLALSEGLLLAERDGIDRELALKVMTESPIGSPMLKARVPLILDPSGEAWFDVALMHKDIRLALQTASDLDVSAPSAAAADQVLTEAEKLGYEQRDIAALREVLDKSSPPAAG
ncbi:MAG TPA: NAD(P)-dependent oxidoreductase [Solirubrobacterales bacterium]|nr:NAD(P)-dependent oxidoreductase [Solirubrobacterales bacterium]